MTKKQRMGPQGNRGNAFQDNYSLIVVFFIFCATCSTISRIGRLGETDKVDTRWERRIAPHGPEGLESCKAKLSNPVFQLMFFTVIRCFYFAVCSLEKRHVGAR